MPVKIKNDSTWQDLGIPMTRVSGEWKPCKQVWTKVSNEWKKVFDLELADDFNGSGNLDGQFTPGHSKWKVYRGSFTKNGSGNVTAGSLNSVAGIETGTDKNIELQIDPGSASESGTGVAFWIQDQSNWWGAQSFYQAYSFSNSPVTGSNFYSCTFTNYTATKNTNAGTPAGVNFIGTTNSSLSPAGSNFQTGSKTCQGGRWTAFSQAGSGCTSSCTETGVPFNTPCSPNGTNAFIRNCGPAGGCTNCGNTTYPTNNSSGSVFSCPLPFSTSSSVCSGTGTLTTTTNYSCTPFSGTPGTFANCTHTASPGGTFATNILSFDNRGYTDANCTPASSASCVYSVQNFVIPGNTVNSTFRQTKLIRSIGGTVSDVSGTINNIGDANTIGGMAVQLYANQVILRSYSTGSKGGTTFPAQTYSIPAGITKGTKHGIVVSGVPTSQGYNISRFKATII